MPILAARKAAIFALVAIMLTGCRYYYTKPGASYSTFTGDHVACVKTVGQPSADGKQAYVAAGPYRGCMQMRGWTRAEQPEPVGPEWFRGLEDDGVVFVDTPPPQPQDDAASTERWSETTCRRLAIAGHVNDPRNRDHCPR